MLYLAIGMVVFRVLESPNEQQGVLIAKEAIALMSIKYNISDQEMREFVKIVTEAEHWGYTSGWVEKWSFTGALFFAGTVVTTIGELLCKCCSCVCPKQLGGYLELIISTVLDRYNKHHNSFQRSSNVSIVKT